VTLTPEQREALEAALEKWDDDGHDRPYIEEAGFVAGMRYAYEDAARVCEKDSDSDEPLAEYLALRIRSRIPKDSA